MVLQIRVLKIAFLHCAFSNDSSNGLLVRMQSHIGYINLTSPQCALWNALSNCLPQRMQSHNGCMGLDFFHCAFSNVPSIRRKSHSFGLQIGGFFKPEVILKAVQKGCLILTLFGGDKMPQSEWDLNLPCWILKWKVLSIQKWEIYDPGDK